MAAPDPQSDIDIIAEQERLLRFTAFDATTAARLGELLRQRALAATPNTPKGCTIEIEAGEVEAGNDILFACATPNAAPDQANWIRRKRNTVHKLRRSSYLVGRALASDNATLESAHGLDEADFAAHGGGFPIFVNDEFLGTIVFSGLPQREDHNLVVSALIEWLGVNAPELD